MKTFKLSISTPIGKNFNIENVVSLNANILEGWIGIMANHSPMISSLKISTFSIELDNGETIIGAIDGGIFNVSPTEVIILTPRFDFADEISNEEVVREINEIEQELQKDVKEAEQQALNDRHIYAEIKLEVANQ